MNRNNEDETIFLPTRQLKQRLVSTRFIVNPTKLFVLIDVLNFNSDDKCG